ncbi:MAG: MaoC/PaaZ C-terminal domain-containing protein [Desulfobacterales bacterium]|jgi:3-hydroxybutyryl-CoA dehydratase
MAAKHWNQAVPVGTEEVFAKTVTETDVYLFAGITGDFYEMHTNEEFAKTTHFKHRIAYGALLVGFVSTVMAKMNDHIPPPGGVSVRYEIDFTAPVYIGDTITTELELSGKTYMKLLKTEQPSHRRFSTHVFSLLLKIDCLKGRHESNCFECTP